MKVTPTRLGGVFVLEPTVYTDERGFFMESYNRRAFDRAIGIEVEFVQDNHSQSSRGVLRGMHFQLPPYAQGKLVRVTAGLVFDAVVDLRATSVTFGQWFGVELSAANRRQIWIPPGFAHGFLVLSETAELQYKTTEYYMSSHERSLRWDDPVVGVEWPSCDSGVKVSEKDASASSWAEIQGLL